VSPANQRARAERPAPGPQSGFEVLLDLGRNFWNRIKGP
jgi:hypothetical protein